MEKEKNGVKLEEETKPVEKAAEVTDVKGNDFEEDTTLSAFEDTESGGIVSQAVNKVVTKYPIQTRAVMSDSGKVYDNYAIAFGLVIGGQRNVQVLRIRPKRKGGAELAERMKLIMSVEGTHNLEITRTEMTIDGRKNVSYSMSASCFTDSGIMFSCPLEPVGEADKALWDTFKLLLISRGELH